MATIGPKPQAARPQYRIFCGSALLFANKLWFPFANVADRRSDYWQDRKPVLTLRAHPHCGPLCHRIYLRRMRIG